MKKEIKSAAAHTFVNPLPMPSIPRGKDEWYRFEHGMFSHENKPDEVTVSDYRSISDPTVFYHGGKWYLYPSYGMAWVSEDFENWQHVRTEPYCPKYSPCIIPWGNRFLLTAWYCPLYVADDPLGPFTCLGDFIGLDGQPFTPCDPCLFADDDGRIYMLAFAMEDADNHQHAICKIVGYELDREQPTRVIQGPVDVIRMNPEKNPWERQGLHNQDPTFGWVEGPHLLKENGRYYLIYAAPDTCHANYAMAVYYSDTSPLSGYVCQKKNPLTIHQHGIVTGAGHGCVERGPNGTLWAFYTVVTACTHRYERRIGMDLCAIDENGELYCPHGVTDTPQYIPGYRADAIQENSPHLVSLTGGIRPTASSEKEGHLAIYATNENNQCWWQPDEDDPKPQLECAFSNTFTTSAVRIFWKEIGLDYQNGVLPEPIGFLLEGCCDGKWFTLVDNTAPSEEKNIDYHMFADARCEKIRLTLLKPKKITVGVIDLAVFGTYKKGE